MKARQKFIVSWAWNIFGGFVLGSFLVTCIDNSFTSNWQWLWLIPIYVISFFVANYINACLVRKNPSDTKSSSSTSNR